MMDTKSMGANALVQISNKDFLTEIAKAAPAGSTMWSCFFSGAPCSSSPWSGSRWQPEAGISTAHDLQSVRNANSYYSVAAFKMDTKGDLDRRKDCFVRLLALVVDDVVLTTVRDEVSYVIETSPGKFQAGVFLDASDPDCANIDLVTELVTQMTKQGRFGGVVGDKGGNNVVRYVRMPCGTNHKERSSGPFTHRTSLWQPEVRLTLEDAALLFGIELNLIRYDAEGDRFKREEMQGMANFADSFGSIDTPTITSTPTPPSITNIAMPTGSQSEKLPALIKNIMSGTAIHDSVNELSGSLIASGMASGSVVNMVRAIMENTNAPKDARFNDRYDDIPRSVQTAEGKYRKLNNLQPFVVDPITNEVKRKKFFTKIGNPFIGLGPAPMVVQKLFELDALSILFGPSGTYKSFVAVDLMCSVATGTEFHGYKTNKMAVIYVAGEGQKGIKTRMAAWSTERGINVDDVEIHCTDCSISMLDEDSIKAASEEIKGILERCQLKLGFIVIDTIARNFGDGDESSAKDVARYLNNIDNYLRVPYGPNVLSIAHSGIEEGRVRGSTAWKAGMDQQYETALKPLGMMELKCHKMKDSKKPDSMTFAMKSVYLRTDIDQFGTEIVTDSLVLTIPPAVTVPTVCKTGREALSPACLVDYMVDGWTSLTDMSSYFGCSRRDVSDCIDETVSLGLIEKSKRIYILTQMGRAQNLRGPGGLGLPDTSQQ